MSLPTVPTGAPTGPVACPQCGTGNRATNAFCYRCGGSLLAAPRPAAARRYRQVRAQPYPVAAYARIVGSAMVGLLPILMLAGVFFSAGRDAPKRVVERYLKAWQRGDWSTVYRLNASMSTGLTEQEFGRQMEAWGSKQATLASYDVGTATIEGDTARVTATLRIEAPGWMGSGSLFGPDGVPVSMMPRTAYTTCLLVKTDGKWKVGVGTGSTGVWPFDPMAKPFPQPGGPWPGF